jgi:hypothetical protein
MLTPEQRLMIARRMPIAIRRPILYVLEQIAEELHEIKTDVALLTEAVVEPEFAAEEDAPKGNKQGGKSVQ